MCWYFVFISLLLFIILLLFARIISHHLLGLSQRVTKPEETLQRQMQSHQRTEKSLLVFCRKSFDIILQTPGRLVNIPGHEAWMQFTLLCFFFFIQSAEQTRTQIFFPLPLLQDRCERSSLSRSTCIPAVKSYERQKHNFRSSFQIGTHSLRPISGAFILKVWVDASWCFGLALTRTTCIHSNSRQSGSSSSSGRGTALTRPPTETRPALVGEGNFTVGEGSGCWLCLQNTPLYCAGGRRQKKKKKIKE